MMRVVYDDDGKGTSPRAFVQYDEFSPNLSQASYPQLEPAEKRICKRANQVLIGLLRHYSYKYYGVEDVTQANAVEVEMSSAGSSTDGDQSEDADSDEERGWKDVGILLLGEKNGLLSIRVKMKSEIFCSRTRI